MTDRPILFSAPMVRAMLDGWKTQTRRILKPQPDDIYEGQIPKALRIAAGHRLWVREAWQTGMSGNGPQISYRATPDFCEIDAWDGPDEGAGPSFNYDRCPCASFHHWLPDVLDNDRPWRPAIHMPRWASRLTLIVKDVRVQKLQEISRGDAMEEGCPFPNMASGPNPRDWFADLWASINGADSWRENPWCAAYTFTVHKANIDAMQPAGELARS